VSRLDLIGDATTWSSVGGRCERCVVSWNARLATAGMPAE
jgi:hypothetical protein